MFELQRIDHVALTVSNTESSVRWYKEVLGLEEYFPGAWGGVPVMIGKGGTCLALFRSSVDKPANVNVRENAVMRHLAFRADRKNFEQAQIDLAGKGIKFEFQDHEISHSIYFNDPDGHKIEITTYELK
jgi:catechol 2,3-dioxygenase-like lactoylglutathione lyase family enzyme